MGDLSKESVARAIAEREQQQQMPPPGNALQRMRNQLLGGDSSLAAYKAYVIDAMSRGETPVSLEEFQQQRMPRNALLSPGRPMP